MITLQSYLTLSAILFAIGIIGIIINRKNIIIILMCTELILLAVNFNFVAFSYFNQDYTGQIFVF
ncbi:MAG: NADH-quinone oxidoreductase subunit NuoK, partial [Gammaproteobacteria bacterium]|nr:NADH-quinone oxidoreductase subunit NuoK [Gammaproteobacteria bacterium]